MYTKAPTGPVLPPHTLRPFLNLVGVHAAIVQPSPSLWDCIVSVLEADALAAKHRVSPSSPWSLLHDNLIYVPADTSLHLDLVRSHHDFPLVRHFGITKTYELLS